MFITKHAKTTGDELTMSSAYGKSSYRYVGKCSGLKECEIVNMAWPLFIMACDQMEMSDTGISKVFGRN